MKEEQNEKWRERGGADDDDDEGVDPSPDKQLCPCGFFGRNIAHVSSGSIQLRVQKTSPQLEPKVCGSSYTRIIFQYMECCLL